MSAQWGTPVPAWRRQHETALAYPDQREIALVKLLDGASAAVVQYGQDGLLRDGVADILKGMRTLLDGDLGRLDGGEVSAIIEQLFAEIGFDPDTETFND